MQIEAESIDNFEEGLILVELKQHRNHIQRLPLRQLPWHNRLMPEKDFSTDRHSAVLDSQSHIVENLRFDLIFNIKSLSSVIQDQHLLSM